LIVTIFLDLKELFGYAFMVVTRVMHYGHKKAGNAK